MNPANQSVDSLTPAVSLNLVTCLHFKRQSHRTVDLARIIQRFLLGMQTYAVCTRLTNLIRCVDRSFTKRSSKPFLNYHRKMRLWSWTATGYGRFVKLTLLVCRAVNEETRHRLDVALCMNKGELFYEIRCLRSPCMPAFGLLHY